MSIKDDLKAGKPLPARKRWLRQMQNFGYASASITRQLDYIYHEDPAAAQADNPNIVFTPYRLNTTVWEPDKTNQVDTKFSQMVAYCIEKGYGSTPPERMYLHFATEQSCTLRKDTATSETEARIVPGVDTVGVVHASRIQAYYWGDGTGVNPYDFCLNPGDADVIEFTSDYYVPAEIAKYAKAEGIYFDTANGYYQLQDGSSQGDPAFWGLNMHEYANYDAFAADINTMNNAIPTANPDALVIGNSYHEIDAPMDGSNFEVWGDPGKSFLQVVKGDSINRNGLESVRIEQLNDWISCVQWSPKYDAVAADEGPDIPQLTQADFQISALAQYYLIADKATYFSFGIHAYVSQQALQVFGAMDIPIGDPIDDVYQVQHENTRTNLLTNGDFSNGLTGWDVSANPTGITVEADERFGNVAVITRADASTNNIYKNDITLDASSDYILSGYMAYDLDGSPGANIYHYDGTNGPYSTGHQTRGPRDFTYFEIKFTSAASPAAGSVRIRTQTAAGTAKFADIQLSKETARNETYLQRNFTTGRTFSHPLPEPYDYDTKPNVFTDPITISLPRAMREVNAGGTLEPEAASITLARGLSGFVVESDTVTHYFGVYPRGTNPTDQQVKDGTNATASGTTSALSGVEASYDFLNVPDGTYNLHAWAEDLDGSGVRGTAYQFTTLPILHSPRTDTVTLTSAKVYITSNLDTGTTYWAVFDEPSAKTPAEIITPTGAADSGNAPAQLTEDEFTATGLDTEANRYYVWYAHTDSTVAVSGVAFGASASADTSIISSVIGPVIRECISGCIGSSSAGGSVVIATIGAGYMFNLASNSQYLALI